MSVQYKIPAEDDFIELIRSQSERLNLSISEYIESNLLKLLHEKKVGQEFTPYAPPHKANRISLRIKNPTILNEIKKLAAEAQRTPTEIIYTLIRLSVDYKAKKFSFYA